MVKKVENKENDGMLDNISKKWESPYKPRSKCANDSVHKNAKIHKGITLTVLISLIVLTPTLLGIAYFSTECTLYIQNPTRSYDSQIDDTPLVPFPFLNDSGDVYYYHENSENESMYATKMVVLSVDSELFDSITSSEQVMLSFYMYIYGDVVASPMSFSHYNFTEYEWFSLLETSNYDVIAGGFGSGIDIALRVDANRYIIPFLECEFIFEYGNDEKESDIPIWGMLPSVLNPANKEMFKTNHGSMRMQMGTTSFNETSALSFINHQYSSLESFPLSFDVSVSKSMTNLFTDPTTIQF